MSEQLKDIDQATWGCVASVHDAINPALRQYRDVGLSSYCKDIVFGSTEGGVVLAVFHVDYTPSFDSGRPDECKPTMKDEYVTIVAKPGEAEVSTDKKSVFHVEFSDPGQLLAGGGDLTIPTEAGDRIKVMHPYKRQSRKDVKSYINEDEVVAFDFYYWDVPRLTKALRMVLGYPQQ